MKSRSLIPHNQSAMFSPPKSPPNQAVAEPVDGTYTLPRLRDALKAISAATLEDLDHQHLPSTLFRCNNCSGDCSCQCSRTYKMSLQVSPLTQQPVGSEEKDRIPPREIDFESQSAHCGSVGLYSQQTQDSLIPRGPGAKGGSYVLPDDNKPPMICEKRNKRKLVMARQEGDSVLGSKTVFHSTLLHTPRPGITQSPAIELARPQSISIHLSGSRSETRPITCACSESDIIQMNLLPQHGQDEVSSPSGQHSLFRYCPHTRRIGPQAHPNRIRELICEWRQREGLSLVDLVALRSRRTICRDLYGWAEKARSNNGEPGHVEKERDRRLNHRDCFAETDLRLPDFVVNLAQEYKEEIIGRKTKTSKPGKDDLHVAILIVLDFDAMLIEELGKGDKLTQDRIQHIKETISMREKYKDSELDTLEAYRLLGQECERQRVRIFEPEQYESRYGELEKINSASPTESHSCKRQREGTRHLPEVLAPISSHPSRSTFVNWQKGAYKLSSDREESEDNYRFRNLSPTKVQHSSPDIPGRSITTRGIISRRNLPSPTPSCVGSWGHINLGQDASSTSSWIND
jgi:hypothetical protein